MMSKDRGFQRLSATPSHRWKPELNKDSKVTVKPLPARKARKGINPFTKEETVFKAKPARNVVKVRPLMALKNMV